MWPTLILKAFFQRSLPQLLIPVNHTQMHNKSMMHAHLHMSSLIMMEIIIDHVVKCSKNAAFDLITSLRKKANELFN